MQRNKLSMLLLQVGAVCTIAGCGGGSDDTSTAPPTTPAANTLSGKVIANQGVQGATVCLDLNKNQQCDAAEPTSAVTGADGAYTITIDPAKTTAEQTAATPMVALLPTAAVDAAAPGQPLATRAIVFTAPAGKGAQINPLTTLVQTAIGSGLSRSDAEAAVAVQLGIAAADIYDYQSQAPATLPFPDNARVMAQVVLAALEDGQSLEAVSLSTSRPAGSSLRQVNYTDANNYYVRSFHDTDEAGTGKRLVLDKRQGKFSGTASTNEQLYNVAFLTPSGWERCGTTFSSTRGKPHRSNYCNGGQPSAGFSIDTDISGKPMGEVIRQIQADTNATHNFNFNASLVDAASFPAGSAITQQHNITLGQSIYVNNLNSANEYLTSALFASLETYIQGRQNANVDLSKNAGLIWLGFTGDTNHWLAGAFVDTTSKVQYYSCTFKTATNSFDVCTPSAQGSFSIVTQGGKRLIKFAGQPSPVDSVGYTVGYAEYSPGVMVRFRETKADSRHLITSNNRLNGTAGDALLKALGL